MGSERARVLRETLAVTYTSPRAVAIVRVESIPQAIAARISSIRFTPRLAEILAGQPAAEWNLAVPAGTTRVITHLARVQADGIGTARFAGRVAALRTYDRTFSVTLRPLRVSSESIRIAAGKRYQLSAAGRLSSGATAPASCSPPSPGTPQTPA